MRRKDQTYVHKNLEAWADVSATCKVSRFPEALSASCSGYKETCPVLHYRAPIEERNSLSTTAAQRHMQKLHVS